MTGKAKQKDATPVVSNQQVCALCVCGSLRMVNLAYWAHSDDLMRAKSV